MLLAADNGQYLSRSTSERHTILCGQLQWTSWLLSECCLWWGSSSFYDHFDCKTRWWSGSDIEDGNLIENPGSAAGRRNHSSNSIRASPSSCPTPRPALHNPLDTNSNISNNTNTNTNTNLMYIYHKQCGKMQRKNSQMANFTGFPLTFWIKLCKCCRYINIWRKNL